MNSLEITFWMSQSSFVCTQLNGFEYFYLTVIISFDINHLFAYSEVVSSIVYTNSFIYIEINSFKYCYLKLIILGPFGWGSRIHWLHLCRGVRLPQQVSWIWHTRQYDGEALRSRSTSLLPLWPGVVAPDRVLSMDQIKLNSVLMLNWIVWNRTVFLAQLAGAAEYADCISAEE